MDWYYSDGHQQFGPVTEAQLDELVAEGRLKTDHLVWRAGMPDWAPLGVVRTHAAAAEPVAHASTATATESAPAVQYCSQCGAAHAPADLLTIGNGVVCANCKDAWLQRLREGVLPGGLSHTGRRYGGFWIRVAASLIDGVILWIIQFALLLPISLIMSATTVAGSTPRPGLMLGFFGLYYVLALAVSAFYEAAFVVYKGGTPGKLALSMRVIREDGTRPGWGLAFGRYFAKIVSSLLLCIGFIMVGFDDEKRGLHDRICGTRVIRV